MVDNTKTSIAMDFNDYYAPIVKAADKSKGKPDYVRNAACATAIDKSGHILITKKGYASLMKAAKGQSDE